MSDRDNMFENVLCRFDRAAQFATIDAEAFYRLKKPKSVVHASIPVRMDDGSLRISEGYRVRHDDTRGPIKGGVRFHPQVHIGETMDSQGTSRYFNAAMQTI
jgi:glutamate dehydrogenase (NADP+)